MSTHSWTYIPVKPQEIESVREDMIDSLKKNYKYWNESNRLDEFVDDQYEKIQECCFGNFFQTKNEFKKSVITATKAIKKVVEKILNSHKSGIEAAIESKLLTDDKYKVVKGEIYKQAFVDYPVRLYVDAPSFTDADELINWIKENETDGRICAFYKENGDVKNELDEEGEETIRQFWREHNNKVYMEFG